MGEHDGEVDIAGTHPAQRVVRVGLLDADLDARVGRLEASDGGRDERGAGGAEGADAERPALQAGQRTQAVLSLGDPTEDLDGMAVQLLAGRRQPHRAGAAVDERQPEFGLERRDVVGDDGLGVAEFERGGRERVPLGDLVEGPNAPQVIHR